MFMAKLATCRCDIAAAACANVDIQPRLSQDSLKPLHIFISRAFIRQVRHFVVANKVDIAAQLARDIHQLLRVLRPIIHITQQNVLKRDFATGAFKVISAGLNDLLDGDALRPGDQRSPHLVVGCVQADRQCDGQLLIREAAACVRAGPRC